MLPEPSIRDLSDLQLLCSLCASDNDQALYTELVNRFLPEVKEKCRRKGELQNLDKHIDEGIAHEVFERVRTYKSFNEAKIRNANEHKAVLAYLCSIAGNLFVDHFRRSKQQNTPHPTYFDQLRQQAGPIDPARLKDIKEMSKSIFQKLTRNEQAVVLADLDNKKYGKYLPDEVTSSLSERLNVKPATIRKIRERAKLKIMNTLRELNAA